MAHHLFKVEAVCCQIRKMVCITQKIFAYANFALVKYLSIVMVFGNLHIFLSALYDSFS
jgi:hypothetical protein